MSTFLNLFVYLFHFCLICEGFFVVGEGGGGAANFSLPPLKNCLDPALPVTKFTKSHIFSCTIQGKMSKSK